MSRETHYPQPSNPYAGNGNGNNGNGIATMRERLAVLETRQEAEIEQLDQVKEVQRDLQDRMSRYAWRVHQLEVAGREAIEEVPRAIEARLAPVTRRLTKLETPWWAPMREHAWKLYLALGMLAFAKGWRLVTGEPLPLGTLLIEWLKH